jgi:hypothetical protein
LNTTDASPRLFVTSQSSESSCDRSRRYTSITASRSPRAASSIATRPLVVGSRLYQTVPSAPVQLLPGSLLSSVDSRVVPLTVAGTDTARAFARSSLLGGAASAGMTATTAAVPAMAASLAVPMPD